MQKAEEYGGYAKFMFCYQLDATTNDALTVIDVLNGERL
jgi:hypothetical protein